MEQVQTSPKPFYTLTIYPNCENMFYELKDYEEMLEYVKENENVIVSVRPKGGCEICELYAPVFKKTFEEIESEIKKNNIKVAILPIDKECIDNLNVCSPTVIFFKKGKEKSRIIVERVPLEKFEKVLKENVKEAFTI